ncbi:MAG TPA: M28 family metallopeptidase [Polyangiaceae bacterium]|nr:M28 family metallopeptidase [Polyangiaceae bacterium]
MHLRPAPVALCLAASLCACTSGPRNDAPPAASSAPASAPASAADEAQRWWSHVEYLASDALEGRNTGSPGHAKAAAYVAQKLAEAGAEPAGVEGFLQPIELEARTVVEEKSRLALVRGGKAEPLAIGEHAVIGARAGEEGRTDAPLVFAGYCLSMPEAGHDDFAGLDLKGKLVACMQGGPAGASAPLRAHASSLGERWAVLERAGALGMVNLANPKFVDIPWERATLARKQPSMVFADPALQEARGARLFVGWNPAHTDRLFEGSGHTLAELLALADAEKPLPRFPLAVRLQAEVAFTRSPVRSQNVAGLLPGADPALRGEVVVMSAHLDHLGVGEPINGDAVYNGAMDNASGVAALLETARALAAGPRPRRSVAFVAVTGEEKGLLGSRHFALHPSVKGKLVADVNVDMFLPLHPLKRLVAYGADESTLKAPLEAVARERGLELLPDREPNRVLFVRSDQYNFVRVGVPALALKFAALPGSPEEQLHRTWVRERYHAPSDDLQQPLDREAAAQFNRLVADLLRRVADAPTPPSWNADSFFRRFAAQPQGAPGAAPRAR